MKQKLQKRNDGGIQERHIEKKMAMKAEGTMTVTRGECQRMRELREEGDSWWEKRQGKEED